MKQVVFFLLLISSFTALNAQSLDYKIIQDWNVEDRSAGMDRTFRFFTNSNSAFIVGAPAALIIGGFIGHDKTLKQAGYDAATTLLLSTAITWGMKYSIHRTRPFDTYPNLIKLSSGGGPSFPSGHASSAFAIATSLSLSYPKWYVAVPAYLYAGTVAVSRVVLGVHYPSDVLVGAAVGFGSACAGHWLNNKIRITKKHAALPVF